jgi:hypothetical protein
VGTFEDFLNARHMSEWIGYDIDICHEKIY